MNLQLQEKKKQNPEKVNKLNILVILQFYRTSKPKTLGEQPERVKHSKGKKIRVKPNFSTRTRKDMQQEKGI